MRAATLLAAALLAGACASATTEITDQSDGTHLIVMEAESSLGWAQHEMTRQSHALCPDGFEILDETSALGWTIKASRRVRCR